jgi:hypothetical protein
MLERHTGIESVGSSLARTSDTMNAAALLVAQSGIEPHVSVLSGLRSAIELLGQKLVGVTGFEPVASRFRAEVSTRLTYTP